MNFISKLSFRDSSAIIHLSSLVYNDCWNCRVRLIRFVYTFLKSLSTSRQDVQINHFNDACYCYLCFNCKWTGAKNGPWSNEIDFLSAIQSTKIENAFAIVSTTSMQQMRQNNSFSLFRSEIGKFTIRKLKNFFYE